METLTECLKALTFGVVVSAIGTVILVMVSWLFNSIRTKFKGV